MDEGLRILKTNASRRCAQDTATDIDLRDRGRDLNSISIIGAWELAHHSFPKVKQNSLGLRNLGKGKALT
jgi:hypothetical protein